LSAILQSCFTSHLQKKERFLLFFAFCGNKQKIFGCKGRRYININFQSMWVCEWPIINYYKSYRRPNIIRKSRTFPVWRNFFVEFAMILCVWFWCRLVDLWNTVWKFWRMSYYTPHISGRKSYRPYHLLKDKGDFFTWNEPQWK
jgi:hypothetical protein